MHIRFFGIKETVTCERNCLQVFFRNPAVRSNGIRSARVNELQSSFLRGSPDEFPGSDSGDSEWSRKDPTTETRLKMWPALCGILSFSVTGK